MAYRYSFNGKEADNEWNSVTGSFQDYGMRMYDTRLARFISVDPLFKDYPWNSTYCFAENDPIRAIDLDGLEKIIISDNLKNRTGTLLIIKVFANTEAGKKLVQKILDPKVNKKYDVFIYPFQNIAPGSGAVVPLTSKPDGTKWTGGVLGAVDAKQYKQLEGQMVGYNTQINKERSSNEREIIPVGINNDFLNFIDKSISSGNSTQLRNALENVSFTSYHELKFHALPIILGTKQDQNVEHTNNYNTPCTKEESPYFEDIKSNSEAGAAKAQIIESVNKLIPQK